MLRGERGISDTFTEPLGLILLRWLLGYGSCYTWLTSPTYPPDFALSRSGGCGVGNDNVSPVGVNQEITRSGLDEHYATISASAVMCTLINPSATVAALPV
jgi:hypothetical protein